jgi:N-acetylmuramoyl-L-alanine amidase
MMFSRQFYLSFFFLLGTIISPVFAQEKDKPQEGEGIYAFLRRNDRNDSQSYKVFLELNKGKFGKNNSLLKGVFYFLPPKNDDSRQIKDLETSNLPTNQKSRIYTQTLFGKKQEEYTIQDNALSGACFFLVSGHGGPDSGAIAKVDGFELHEDEYAYDIMLRLAKNLLQHGAKVHIIIQDKKDGIRDDAYLTNSKRETCLSKEIPLNQVLRLKQRCDAINHLNVKATETYKRAIFIHLDSRSKKQQLDVFFYYQDKAGNKKRSRNLANTMSKTFKEQYQKNQPERGFSGTVSTRPLYVLQNTNPVSVFVELANMQNVNDQKRYILVNNRQALANWLCLGFISDYKASK